MDLYHDSVSRSVRVRIVLESKTMRILITLMILAGCSSTHTATPEPGGEAGNSDDGEASLTIVSNPGGGSEPVTPKEYFEQNECDTMGDRRDATTDEKAEYCVCDEYEHIGNAWQCYGLDPNREKVRPRATTQLTGAATMVAPLTGATAPTDTTTVSTV